LKKPFFCVTFLLSKKMSLASQPALQHLADELICEVLSFLPLADYARLALTSKYFCTIVTHSDMVWQHLNLVTRQQQQKQKNNSNSSNFYACQCCFDLSSSLSTSTCAANFQALPYRNMFKHMYTQLSRFTELPCYNSASSVLYDPHYLDNKSDTVKLFKRVKEQPFKVARLQTHDQARLFYSSPFKVMKYKTLQYGYHIKDKSEEGYTRIGMVHALVPKVVVLQLQNKKEQVGELVANTSYTILDLFTPPLATRSNHDATSSVDSVVNSFDEIERLDLEQCYKEQLQLLHDDIEHCCLGFSDNGYLNQYHLRTNERPDVGKYSSTDLKYYYGRNNNITFTIDNNNSATVTPRVLFDITKKPKQKTPMEEAVKTKANKSSSNSIDNSLDEEDTAKLEQVIEQLLAMEANLQCTLTIENSSYASLKPNTVRYYLATQHVRKEIIKKLAMCRSQYKKHVDLLLNQNEGVEGHVLLQSKVMVEFEVYMMFFMYLRSGDTTVQITKINVQQ